MKHERGRVRTCRHFGLGCRASGRLPPPSPAQLRAAPPGLPRRDLSEPLLPRRALPIFRCWAIYARPFDDFVRVCVVRSAIRKTQSAAYSCRCCCMGMSVRVMCRCLLRKENAECVLSLRVRKQTTRTATTSYRDNALGFWRRALTRNEAQHTAAGFFAPKRLWRHVLLKSDAQRPPQRVLLRNDNW